MTWPRWIDGLVRMGDPGAPQGGSSKSVTRRPAGGDTTNRLGAVQVCDDADAVLDGDLRAFIEA